MPYASVLDIQEEMRGLMFSSESIVTKKQVEKFLDEADAEINLRIGSVYQIPVTDAQALIFLRMVETWLVKARIQDILAINIGDSKLDQNFGSQALRDRAMTTLDLISAGKFELYSAGRIDTTTSATLRHGWDGEDRSVFRLNQEQW